MAFSGEYFFDETPDWPHPGEAVVTFSADNQFGDASTDYLNVRFHPLNKAEPWTARFQCVLHSNNPGLICTTPSPHKALIVAGGAGFLLDVFSRESVLLPAFPITHVLSLDALRLLLVLDFGTVTAITEDAFLRSGRLVDDELTVSKTPDEALRFSGFDSKSGEERGGVLLVCSTPLSIEAEPDAASPIQASFLQHIWAKFTHG